MVLLSVEVQVDVAAALPLDEPGGGPPRPTGVQAAQRGFLVQVREWPLSRPFCRRKACGVVRDRDSDGDMARDRDRVRVRVRVRVRMRGWGEGEG